MLSAINISCLADVPHHSAQVAHAAWNEWHDTLQHELGLHSLEAVEAYYLNKRDTMYIAHTDEGAFLGMISIEPGSDLPTLYPHDSPWLADLFVCEHARGRGVAARLIRHVQTVCPSSCLHLWCKASLECFYATFGFQTRHRHTYLGHEICVMHWDRELLACTLPIQGTTGRHLEMSTRLDLSQYSI